VLACGMRLTVIGSADAFNAAGRGHSCYVVESEAAGTVMLDFGPTALQGLRRHATLTPSGLDGVLFTHLHGDHIGGFPFLVIDALWNGPRGRALPILGPLHTRRSLEALLDANYGETIQRLPAVPVVIDELEPGSSREFLGYRVDAYAAEHMPPPHRPLCLRLTDRAGVSIAFSGDTLPCPGLFAAADGVDLLVAECTRLSPPAGQHCTWEDWRRELPGLRARALLLSHLGADVRERLPGLAAEVEGSLPVRFADDGLVVELG